MKRRKSSIMANIMPKLAASVALLCMQFLFAVNAQAESAKNHQEYLVKLADPSQVQALLQTLNSQTLGQSSHSEILSEQWVKVSVPASRSAMLLKNLEKNTDIEFIQPNYPIHLLDGLSIQDPLRRAALMKGLSRNFVRGPATDNPLIPAVPPTTSGSDPLFAKQWGMIDIGVEKAWNITLGDPNMIVAVIDTGVDYTHEDLLPNIWRNSKEVPDNGVDDDNNGFVDDIVGWDFAANDNKPYDFKGQANPGHGTHCAGNVAAKGFNGTGISGVAPNVKIMALRFLTENGSGTTADAIKAIRYAVQNGAKVLSNSWGSEGEDPEQGEENKALREAIQFAQDAGTLFIAAAGNGHKGVGYNNDIDKMPAYPASYDHDSIISVAALDKNNKLGSFSNWGSKTVDIGAPGVAVFSTTVGGTYSSTVYPNLPFLTWDGTSMATPHVAGAAALYWSAHPSKTWKEVKQAILATAVKIPVLQGKAVSEGKLNVEALLNYTH